MTDRDTGLPHHTEDERSLIAAILVDPSCAHQIIDGAPLTDYHDGRHRVIMQAVTAVCRQGLAPDLPTVAAELHRAGHAGSNGYSAYLSSLLDNEPAAIDIPARLRRIRETAVVRRAMEQMSRLLHGGAPTIDDIEGAISEIHSTLRDTQQASSSDRSFRLIPISELEMRAPEWLIDGIMECDTLASLYGDPAAGKSFAAIDMAACIAMGVDYHGRVVMQGTVIYIAGEGRSGIGRRLMAWSIRHSIDLSDAPLYLSMMPAALTDPASVDQVITAMDAAAEQSGPPVLAVVDTLARNYGAADENSTQDMTRFVAACDRIRERYRSTVLVIHHTGHGDRTRARGSVALRAAVDTEYQMDRDTSGICRLECKKTKDSEEMEPMAFRLRSVELPITGADDYPVTSAVLDDADYEPPEPGSAGLGKWQTMALDVLDRLTVEHRQRLADGGYDPDSARVSYDDWRAACMAQGMHRQGYHRARHTLIKRQMIIEDHGYVTRV